MNKYTEYAEDVISGKIIACKEIKLACQRYLDWMNRDDIEFIPSKAEKVVNFIEKLKHFKEEHAGKPFRLLPYQKWIVYNIFGFYWKKSNKRVIRYAYMELARKSGKTAFVAAILLYMMIADGNRGAECEMVANSSKQAHIAFDYCSKFLRTLDPKGKYFKRYRDSIKFDATDSFMQVLSSDAGGNDGYNSSCFVLDECHEQSDSKLWDVMTSSQGMRKNPLGIIITTAGFNLYGFCYSYRETCIEILKGVKEDDSQFAAIYTQDPDDDINDKSLWIKSNPSLGQTVYEDYLEIMMRKAQNNSSELVNVMTKNFNCWYSSSEEWIPANYILDSTIKVDLENYRDMNAWLGLDLAEVSDLTALSVCIPTGKDEEVVFKNYYFIPESELKGNPNAEYFKEMKRNGHVIVTPTKVTDYDYVIRTIKDISEILNIYKISYDRALSRHMLKDCVSNGFNMVVCSQSISEFTEPTRDLERRIRMGNVLIDNNPITRWCFSNVELLVDSSNNVKPTKGVNQNKKIDGVIAMIQALKGYTDEPFYSSQEITTFTF